VRRMTKVDEAKAVPRITHKSALLPRFRDRPHSHAATTAEQDLSSLMPDRIPAGQTLKIQILQRRVLM
jgi:hypothetical protein